MTTNGFIGPVCLRWAFLFVVVFPLSFPFGRNGILPDPGLYAQEIFEPLARFSAGVFVGESTTYVTALMSDTAGFYFNALNIALISLAGALVWKKFFRTPEVVLLYLLVTVARHYLALQLFWYGFDKVFKVQFYLPEPNTLFTTVGETPRDLLYWSTMGSSYTYTVFAGITEVLAAALLLHRRSFVVGALAALAILSNVLMINLGFDISVKLYTCFLLLLCLICMVPYVRALYAFFVLQVPARLQVWRPVLYVRQRGSYLVAKWLVVALLLADTLWPFVRAGNFNDDVYPRPFLHGAYAVETFSVNGQTIEACESNANRWKRFFVHRRGYFIVQRMNGEMHDFELDYDTGARALGLRDYDKTTCRLHYVLQGKNLHLSGFTGRDTIAVQGRYLPLDRLPLLKNEFGWTIR